jgi:hypothetical protein
MPDLAQNRFPLNTECLPQELSSLALDEQGDEENRKQMDFSLTHYKIEIVPIKKITSIQIREI